MTSFGTSGTGTFTLPDSYADKTCGTDYYAYIIAEDVNGTYETDYASDPASASITIPGSVSNPTFSVEEGTYIGTQNVELSCETTGATIYYTTDGSTPTASGKEYTSPITVSETTTIKAIAVKAGMYDSGVGTASYTKKTIPVESMA